MTKSNDERLAIMETKVNTLQSDVTEIKSDLKTLIDKIDSNYLTKDEFKAFKQSQVWQKALIAVLFSFIGALITYFINDLAR